MINVINKVWLPYKVKTSLNPHYFFIVFIFIGLFGRLLPHPANVAPSINLSLLAGMFLPCYLAFFFICSCNLIVDLLLGYLKDYSVFGNWSIFTYSGLLVISYFGFKVNSFCIKNIASAVLISSFWFWLWTNFGIWLLDGHYSYNLQGLLLCYKLAIPFLKNSILGDLFWMIIIFMFGLNIAAKNIFPREQTSPMHI